MPIPRGQVGGCGVVIKNRMPPRRLRRSHPPWWERNCLGAERGPGSGQAWKGDSFLSPFVHWERSTDKNGFTPQAYPGSRNRFEGQPQPSPVGPLPSRRVYLADGQQAESLALVCIEFALLSSLGLGVIFFAQIGPSWSSATPRCPARQDSADRHLLGKADKQTPIGVLLL